jgi:hypothetical protein
MTAHLRLDRQVFKTSRLLEFCSPKELVLQTGHPIEQWPFVVLKELADNGLDASEQAKNPRTIKVIVQPTPTPSITVTGNGPGIPLETVKAMLDFSVRASSNEADASPTRGAQGNALTTLIAMPFGSTVKTAPSSRSAGPALLAQSSMGRRRGFYKLLRITPCSIRQKSSRQIRLGTSGRHPIRPRSLV